MILQYAAAGLFSEIRVLSTPASVDNVPTSAGQEDPIIFGLYAAKKAFQVTKKLSYIFAIDYLAQTQALDFIEGQKNSPALRAVYDVIRKQVPTVGEDRFYGDDLEKIRGMIEDGSLVRAAEATCGELEY